MEGGTCLIVRAGETLFGIPIETVAEVIRVPASFEAGAPIRYRGGDLPVADLGAHMGDGGARAPDPGRILVLKGGSPAALRVTDVEGLFTVPERVGSAGSHLPLLGPLKTSLTGMARHGEGELVFLLDAGAFFSAFAAGEDPEAGRERASEEGS